MCKKSTKYKVCPGSKPGSKCPPELLLQIEKSAWVMKSGCSMVNTAKRTEWCPSSRLMCSTASDGDLMLMKTNLKFYCFQEAFFPQQLLLRCVICYATVLCYCRYISWICVIPTETHFSNMNSWLLNSHESLNRTPAGTLCLFLFSFEQQKGHLNEQSLRYWRPTHTRMWEMENRHLLRAISSEKVHQKRILSLHRHSIMYMRSSWVQKQDKTIF